MTTFPAAQGGVVLGVLPLATAAAAAIIAHEWPSVWFWLMGAIGRPAVHADCSDYKKIHQVMPMTAADHSAGAGIGSR